MSTAGPATSPGEPSLDALFVDWPQYADRLVVAVRDLTPEQLAHRAGPEHGQIWQLAAHVAGARTFWLCETFGEPGADATPFADPASGSGWEDDESHPRSGAELAWALDSTWGVIASCLERWSLPTLVEPLPFTFGDVTRYHSRSSILNRLFSHDAFHAGEISQLLGVNGLPAIDLWARDRSRS
ncbi:MAG: DinB family protein [Candidatus Limnocylindrales bacterium]